MATDTQKFAGRATWQYFYDQEHSFDVLSLEEADRRLIESNDAKDDYMKIGIPTHTKVVARNQPCEDAVVKGQIEGADRTYEVWAVFDGHAGWNLSWRLRREMIPWLTKYLRDKDVSEPEKVVANIKEAFISYDKHIHDEAIKALDLVHNKDVNALTRGWLAVSSITNGSCVLVCVYDTKEETLYTAVVGDSRAILLRSDDTKTLDSPYAVHVLSVDQNGYNTAETDRIKSEHPGEEPIEDKVPYRTLGIMVTRAFGDHRWKLPKEMLQTLEKKLKGSPPLEKALTPPYLTAEPEVTVTKIQKGDILVMGSDGLWDHLTNEGAAECMQEWMKQFGSSSIKAPGSKLPHRDQNTISRPFEFIEDYDYDWKFQSENVVAEDENAATSLIRNSIGGNRRELFTAVMSAPIPIGSNVCDDVSVHVAFF